jgi:DNA repair protein RecN (Recombination protein N)
MVAVTLALASAHAVPSLIFDEADQGVGGAAALELARRLARLGETHQVLVVTHLPQIAAFARTHLVVDKEDGRVTVSECHGEDRVAELARMLSGLGESARGRAHAAELLELAGAETKAELKSKRKASSSVQTVG